MIKRPFTFMLGAIYFTFTIFCFAIIGQSPSVFIYSLGDVLDSLLIQFCFIFIAFQAGREW